MQTIETNNNTTLDILFYFALTAPHAREFILFSQSPHGPLSLLRTDNATDADIVFVPAFLSRILNNCNLLFSHESQLF